MPPKPQFNNWKGKPCSLKKKLAYKGNKPHFKRNPKEKEEEVEERVTC